MTYTITSTSGTHNVDIATKVCNGDSSYVSYQMIVNGKAVQGGVCKSADIIKMVKAYARRVYVGVVSVSQS